MDLLQYFAKATPLSSSDVLNLVDEEISLVTVKRQLSTLTKADYLEQVGAGRSTKYLLNKKANCYAQSILTSILQSHSTIDPLTPVSSLTSSNSQISTFSPAKSLSYLTKRPKNIEPTPSAQTPLFAKRSLCDLSLSFLGNPQK